MSFPSVVLCVDDDPYVLEMNRRVLEASGFAVVTASGGPEALQVVAGCRIDAAVLDFTMPGMDGAQLAAALRELVPRVPIVFYTGSEELLGNARLRIADAFVQKGAPIGVLADILHSLIARVSRRGAVRHPISVPVTVHPHRPGRGAAVLGRSFDLSESGVGSELDATLVPGQVVSMSIRLPHSPELMNTAARVAYSNGVRHGFQFLALTPQQRALLRTTLPPSGAPN